MIISNQERGYEGSSLWHTNKHSNSYEGSSLWHTNKHFKGYEGDLRMEGMKKVDCDTQTNICDRQTNICDRQTNICDTQTNICDTQTNICDTQTNIFLIWWRVWQKNVLVQFGLK